MLLVQLFSAFLDYLLRREQNKRQIKQQAKELQRKNSFDIEIKIDIKS